MLNYTYDFQSKPDLKDQKRTKNTLYLYVFIYIVQESDIKEKDTKRSQKNKTEHGIGMSVRSQKSTKVNQKVNPDRVKVNSEKLKQKYNLRDQKCQIPKLYYKNKRSQGLNLQFTQNTSMGTKSAKPPYLYHQRTNFAMKIYEFRGHFCQI